MLSLNFVTFPSRSLLRSQTSLSRHYRHLSTRQPPACMAESNAAKEPKIAVLTSSKDLGSFLKNGGRFLCVKPSPVALETLRRISSRISTNHEHKPDELGPYCARVDDVQKAKEMFAGQSLTGKPVIGLAGDNVVMDDTGKVFKEFADWDCRTYKVFDIYDGIDEEWLAEEAVCFLLTRSDNDPHLITMRKAAKRWSRPSSDKGGLTFLWYNCGSHNILALGIEADHPEDWPRVIIRTRHKTFVLWDNAKSSKEFTPEVLDRFFHSFYVDWRKLKESKFAISRADSERNILLPGELESWSDYEDRYDRGEF